MQFYRVTMTVPVEPGQSHPSLWDWYDLVGMNTKVETIVEISNPQMHALNLALGNAGIDLDHNDVLRLAEELENIGADFN